MCVYNQIVNIVSPHWGQSGPTCPASLTSAKALWKKSSSSETLTVTGISLPHSNNWSLSIRKMNSHLDGSTTVSLRGKAGRYLQTETTLVKAVAFESSAEICLLPVRKWSRAIQQPTNCHDVLVDFVCPLIGVLIEWNNMRELFPVMCPKTD